jgi:hypothetical protein
VNLRGVRDGRGRGVYSVRCERDGVGGGTSLVDIPQEGPGGDAVGILSFKASVGVDVLRTMQCNAM